MSNVQIKFPDGSVRDFESGVTGFDVARSISPRLAKEAVSIKVDGIVTDLNRPVADSAPVQILTFNDPEGRQVFWHSSSHIMAQAVQELFPKVKLAIGPPIDTGWYYDFEVDKPFTPEDLERIEKRMKEIVTEKAAFSCQEKPRKEAIEYFKSKDANYKVEILEDLDVEKVTFYYQSRFEDLCRGPHIPSTGIVKAFKLTSTSGAYWRGDEKRQMLQRIYGVSFPKKSLLDEHLELLEEAKKRDHRLLGKQLELFHFSEEIGAGLVLWMPKGGRIRNEIENFWRQEHLKYGYELLFSPHIAHRSLWERSGHTDFYSESMFGPMEVDQHQYQLKPMNCPFHILIYKDKLHSYRDLPVRMGELGTVYRYERSGVMHGLLRVRGFTQDDAHIFCTPQQVEEEILGCVEFALLSVGNSQIGMRLCQVGVNSNRLFEFCNGIVEFALLSVGKSHAAMCYCIVRVNFNRLLQFGNGCVSFALPIVRAP
ncbi:MAG: threonine--tRNA ligase [candidate division Zixibacteria bacterium]|nr:threonine--tRNA ligase [candidate division Zixibacteria bacterium]